MNLLTFSVSLTVTVNWKNNWRTSVFRPVKIHSVRRMKRSMFWGDRSHAGCCTYSYEDVNEIAPLHTLNEWLCPLVLLAVSHRVHV